MNERGEGNKSLLWIILVVVAIFLILLLTGIIDFSSEGDLKAPDVDVSASGGEVPDIDADVGDVDVGTEETTVEVPTVDVDKADAEATDDD